MVRQSAWSGWSVRRRILTLSTAVLVAAMALGIGGFAVALDRSLYASARDATQAQTEQISGILGADRKPIAEAVADVPSRDALIQVVNKDGAVLASSDPAVAATAVTSLRPIPGAQLTQQVSTIPGEVGEPHAVVVQGIRASDGSALYLVVATPLDVADSVRTAVILLLIGCGVLLALLIFLIDRVVTGALRPVERIRTEVSGIRRVRTQHRVTVPPTGDEVARLAVTMNSMLDRLEQADEATRRFVADASHELRSPLATIRAATEVAASEVTTPQGRADPMNSGVSRDEALAVVGAEALRMQALVDSLLTLAKIDDDGLRLSLSDVDLDDVVDEEARRLRTSGGVPVRTSIEAARVIGDEARLKQVLRNLTDNAQRHARSAVRVSVGTDQETGWFAVEDDGPGIPEEDRTRVFERFVRLDGSRERDSGGSGLGLAIVASVVEAHGGGVRASTTAEGWCRVEVSLPVAGPSDRHGDDQEGEPPMALEHAHSRRR